MLRKLLPLKPQMLLNPNTAVFKKKKKNHGNVLLFTTKAISYPQVVTHLIFTKSTNYVQSKKDKISDILKYRTTVITNT